MSETYEKTGRFIRMDLKKWSNPKICSQYNKTEYFEDGKIYTVYERPDGPASDFYIQDSTNRQRYIMRKEIEVLEISLSEALIEMSREIE